MKRYVLLLFFAMSFFSLSACKNPLASSEEGSSIENKYNPGITNDEAAYLLQVISGDAQTGVVSSVLSSPIEVQLFDIRNNPVPSVALTFLVESGNGSISNSEVTTDSNGKAQVQWTLGSTIGSQSLKITKSLGTLIGSPNGITITATAVAGTVSTSNSSISGTSSVIANGTNTSTITISLKDNNNNPVPGMQPTFAATDTGSTNNYGTCSVTDANGQASCTLASTKAEVKVLQITSPISKTDGSVTFIHGPAAQLVFTTQPSGAVANTVFSTQPAVAIQDAHGNTVTSGVDASATVTMLLSSGTGTLSGTVSVSASSGIASWSNLKIDAYGSKVITASKADLSGSGGIGTLAVASNSFTNSSNPPSVPTGLAASVSSASSIHLVWSASAGQAPINYEIYRSTSSGSGYTLLSTQSGLSYDDNTATAGTTYYYVIKASDVGGTSNYSSEVSATAIGAFALTSLTRSSANALSIAWNPSTGASTYRVKYGTASGTYTTTASSNATSPYEITGLSEGTTYYVRVYAENTSGSVASTAELSELPYGPPAKLVLTGGDTNLVSGFCSTTPYTITLTDNAGTPSPHNDMTLIFPETSSAGPTFHGSIGCTSAPSTFKILNAGQTTAQYYIRSYLPFSGTVQMSSTYPAGIATSSTSNLSVTVSTNPTRLDTIFGQLESTGEADGALGTSKMFFPEAMTSDGTYIYFTDTYNNSIRKFDPSTGTVSTLAGSSGECSNVDGIASVARFCRPSGIAYSSVTGTLWVVDGGNHKIKEVTLTGTTTTRAGAGNTFADGDGTAAKFNNPGQAVALGNYLYIADKQNHRIRAMTLTAPYTVTTLTGNGTGTSTDGSPGTHNYPWGITTDGTDLFVSDSSSNRIRKVVISTATASTLAGDGTFGFVDNAIGTSARFSGVRHLAYLSGKLYVADTYNNRIRSITLSNNFVTTITGSSTAGSTSSTLASSTFASPMGIIAHGSDLYTFDINQTMRKIDLTNSTVSVVAGISLSWGNSNSAFTLARFQSVSDVEKVGDFLYIAEKNFCGIKRADLTTGTITTWIGNGTCAHQDGVGSAAKTKQVYNLFSDGTYLYFSDYGGHRVKRATIADGTVITLAGTGTAGSVDNVVGTSATVDSPRGLVKLGNILYFGNTNKVRAIDLSDPNYPVSTLAGSTCGTVDATGTSAAFCNVFDIATDGTNLFVADFWSHRIRKVTTAGVVTSLTTGGSGYQDGIASAAKFKNPQSISFADGYLYITENYNNSVRKIDATNGTTTTIVGTSKHIEDLDGLLGSAQIAQPFCALKTDIGTFICTYTGIRLIH